MAGGPGRAREARGGAGGTKRGDQEQASRSPLGRGREGVRVRHRGRQEDPRRALRRALTAARLQHHVRPRLHARRLPRLHQPGRRARRLARPPEPPRRDAALFLAGADRAADRLQAADGLAVPLRLHLQHRFRLRLRPCDDRGAGAADSRSEGDDRRPTRLAPGMVAPGRSGAQGRAARGPELDRLRARGRNRLPHLHGDGARPVCRALLQLPARANAEGPPGRAPDLAEGRVPGLTPIGTVRGGRTQAALRGLEMAKLIYSAVTSLDGYIEDAEGKFDWAEPDEEVHAFVNDLERPVGTYLYGRRMYETMAFWESPHELSAQPPVVQDFAGIWQRADKIVYSRTLQTVTSAKTLIEREFDPEAIRQLKAKAGADLSVGGPELAAQAIKAGLVDEYQLFLVPVVVGDGKRSLPGNDVRVNLELLDQRTFRNGTVYLHSRTRS